MTSPDDAVLRVVRDVLAPLVRADGGRIYVVDIDHKRVHLHLAGRYAGCPGTSLAREALIEPALASVAAPRHVHVTNGTLIPPGAELID